MEAEKLNILIGGDLVPTPTNAALFSNGDVTSLLGEELFSIWGKADIRIFNLEVPLTDRENPISKCGPNLIAPTTTVKGIKALNPDLLTLANNHILDQGEAGLASTIQLLVANKIPHVGAGDNLADSSEPYIIESAGKKVGIYACAEHEFTIATISSPGANPFDPLESLDHIQRLKARCDYVIVLYHGGKEYYRYPSPNLQKVCRKMVEKGADLIVCQHSHCIGCVEEYRGATIVYGQGNFIFDNSESEYWKTSLLLDVKIENELHVHFIPIVKSGNTVRLAIGKQGEDILEGLWHRTNEIKQEGFIYKNYSEFAKKMFNRYLTELHGNNVVLKILNKISKRRFIRRLYSPESLRIVQNFIECEAHRELILCNLENERNENG